MIISVDMPSRVTHIEDMEAQTGVTVMKILRVRMVSGGVVEMGQKGNQFGVWFSPDNNPDAMMQVQWFADAVKAEAELLRRAA